MTHRPNSDSDDIACVRCLEPNERPDLDRLLWCDGCRATARAKAGRWGWGAGMAIAVLLSAWIWLVVQPTLLIGAWVGTVLAAFWIGAKAAREVIYGTMRLRDAPTVEAPAPPDDPPEEERRVRFR